MSEPRYQQIQRALRQRIESGQLRPGDRVPSENQLGDEFSVSRMTARRALHELADSGLLLRAQGLGTFVADTRPMSSVTQVRDIQDEIAQRGHRHTSRVLRHQQVSIDEALAIQLDLAPGEVAFHTELVHFEDDRAIQHERRWVTPRMAPGYMQQDFETTTPSAYLFSLLPLTEAEQSVEAVLPEAAIATALAIDAFAPCLLLRRRTFFGDAVMSVAMLVHPGDRYRLGSHIHVRPHAPPHPRGASRP